jgi:hypothetical protein
LNNLLQYDIVILLESDTVINDFSLTAAELIIYMGNASILVSNTDTLLAEGDGSYWYHGSGSGYRDWLTTTSLLVARNTTETWRVLEKWDARVGCEHLYPFGEQQCFSDLAFNEPDVIRVIRTQHLLNGWTGLRVRHFNNIGLDKKFPIRAHFLRHASCEPIYTSWGSGGYLVEENIFEPVTFPFVRHVSEAIVRFQEGTRHWTHFDMAEKEPGRGHWGPMVVSLKNDTSMVNVLAYMVWAANMAFSIQKYVCISSESHRVVSQFFMLHEPCPSTSVEHHQTIKSLPASPWASGIARSQFWLTPDALVRVRKRLMGLLQSQRYDLIFGNPLEGQVVGPAVVISNSTFQQAGKPSSVNLWLPFPKTAESEIDALVLSVEAQKILVNEASEISTHALLLRGN